MPHCHNIALKVNGSTHELQVEDRLNLADCLRHTLNLTGTHVGCEHGACGACTVLVDGRSVRSCLMLAVQADGSEVETVESLAENGLLSELQDCLSRNHGLQCGYCTPGVLMTLTEFFREIGDNPCNEEEVRRVLSGNLCRCTGYQGIVDTVLELLAARNPG